MDFFAQMELACLAAKTPTVESVKCANKEISMHEDLA
jgi:hypothetical protein